MTTITDLYHALFGKSHIKDGDVIEFSEHGRIGGLSTGQGFKHVVDMSGLQIPAHDYIALTYVTSGNGLNEIETATYKSGGASGTTVATLTLTYNSIDEIETITRT